MDREEGTEGRYINSYFISISMLLIPAFETPNHVFETPNHVSLVGFFIFLCFFFPICSKQAFTLLRSICQAHPSKSSASDLLISILDHYER